MKPFYNIKTRSYMAPLWHREWWGSDGKQRIKKQAQGKRHPTKFGPLPDVGPPPEDVKISSASPSN